MRNAQGFDEFYRTSSRRLLGYAYAVSRDWAQAQDLTQEAYLRAWRHWNKLSHYADPESWLRLVVVRLATDFWRRLGRRDTAYQRTAASITDVAGPSEETIMVTRALLALPAQQRQAIAMHYLFDVPVAQIANDLGVPEGTVKSWLSRGRIALADLLDPERERQIPASSQVRAAGDRRARRRAVAGAVTAVFVLLVGVAGAVVATRMDNTPPIIPLESPSAVPSTPPSPTVSPTPNQSPLPRPSGTDLPAVGVCDDTYPKTLPAGLFQMGFQRRELCFKPRTQQGNPPVELILPHPCRPMTNPSDALILDRRAKEVTYNEGTTSQPAPVMWAHTVTKYGPGGAEAYLTELREALDRCGPFTANSRNYDYRELTGFGAGPDRVVIREEWNRPDAQPDEQKNNSAVILVQRVKDYVVVIFDWGWEVFPSKDETITNAMTNAVAMVNAL